MKHPCMPSLRRFLGRRCGKCKERFSVEKMGNDSKQIMQDSLTKLIREAQNGSQTAFEALLNRYAPLIDSMTGRYLGTSFSLQDREDFRQEAVLSFYRALMRFDTEQDKVQFGLYAKECIRNGLISMLRVIKKHENVVLLDDDSVLTESNADEIENPAQRLVEEEAYLALSRRIHESLSPYENSIWWLYLSGRTAREIARLMGKDEKSVQNAVYRIRKKLRAVIPYS